MSFKTAAVSFELARILKAYYYGFLPAKCLSWSKDNRTLKVYCSLQPYLPGKNRTGKDIEKFFLFAVIVSAKLKENNIHTPFGSWVPNERVGKAPCAVEQQ